MPVFDRKKHITVDLEGDRLVALVDMDDTFHHIRVRVAFTALELEIVEASAEMLRVPHAECHRALPAIERAVGLKVQAGFNRAVAHAVGGRTGCFHFTTLVGEAALAAVQARYAAADQLLGTRVRALPRPERVRLWVEMNPAMLDSCLTWSCESPMLQEAFPEGSPCRRHLPVTAHQEENAG